MANVDDKPTVLPFRVGVIFADLGGVRVEPLRYLVVHLNVLQRSFEFEILPTLSEDSFIQGLGYEAACEREECRREVRSFVGRMRAALSDRVNKYHLAQAPPEYVVVVSMACFTDRYYSMREDSLGVLALGNWKRHLAPPSLLEFMITLIVRQAVGALVPALSGSVHLGTKGCLCDFTASLDEVRYKTLQGFICSYCRGAFEKAGLGGRIQELEAVLAKEWLGTVARPSSVASITAKLGYNLFWTKGKAPTLWESVRNTLRDETVKQLLTIAGGVALAYLLFRFGLKK